MARAVKTLEEKLETRGAPPLSNARAVRKFLARLVYDAKNGTIDPSDASKIGSICQVLLRALEMQIEQDEIKELRKRLEQVEKQSGRF